MSATNGTSTNGPRALPRHKGTAKTVSAARRLARRRKAFELLKRGLTFRAIGKELGVSHVVAWLDCKAVFEQESKTLQLDVDEWRALHVERTEGIVQAHFGKKAQTGSAQTVLKALDYQAKLIPGLHQAPEGTYTQDQVIALMRGVATLFMELVDDADLRKRFAMGVRRRLGSAAIIEARAEPAAEQEADDEPADVLPTEA